MKKSRMFGLFAAMALITALGVSARTAFASAEAAASESRIRETSASLTEDWFGEAAISGVLCSDELEKWTPVIDAYEEARTQSFLGEITLKETTYESSAASVLAVSADVAADEETRSACIEEMQARMDIEVTGAVTTVFVRSVTEEDDQIVLQLYEWTFFDYIDPEGDGVTTDVSGYGVEHTVTVVQDAFGYEIVSDVYDEGELTGMQSSDYEDETLEETISLSEETYDVSYAAGYDPDKVVAYADTYVKSGISGSVDSSYYNASYLNMNSLGGDCANYVSQCIYAGGMEMDSTWYYNNSSSFTSAWATARYQYTYMSTRGKAISNPSASQIYTGSPVYYKSAGSSNISHAAICVGTNSAGTPVVNSHNNDYYHVRWNYWGDSCTYYTVQLTTKNNTSNASSTVAAAAATATPRPTISTTVYGDLSDNGEVDATDALEILKGVVNIHTFTEKDLEIGDVDGDGDVDAVDALLVLQKVVGLISVFPVEGA